MVTALWPEDTTSHKSHKVGENGHISRNALMEAGNAHAVLHELRFCADRQHEILRRMRDSGRPAVRQRPACYEFPGQRPTCGPGSARRSPRPGPAWSLGPAGPARPVGSAGPACSLE